MKLRSNTVRVSASGLLFISAIPKLISAFGASRMLQEIDAITGLSNQEAYIVAGLLEVLVGVLLLFRKTWAYGEIGLAWLGVTFFAYHMISVTLGLNRACPCLGNALDWWPWLVGKGEWVSWGILLVLLGFGAILIKRRLIVIGKRT